MKKNIFITAKIDPVTKEIQPVSKQDQIILDMYLKGHEKNSDFEIVIGLGSPPKTNLQLARIHTSIREIADFSGMSFDEVKDHIKREASLYEYSIEGSSLKSFSRCTKIELDAAIKTAEKFAANIGCVLNI